MSVEYCINLVRNIHQDIYEADSDMGLPGAKVFLDTPSQVDVPYLLLQRGDEIITPWSAGQVLAHVIGLEYVIGEGSIEGQFVADPVLDPDQVGKIRRLDEAFMDRLTQHEMFRSSSDVDEGLSEQRPAYLLTRTLELTAGVHVSLDPKLEPDYMR